ncbi:MAG: Acylneuraminate cytidylyltransferase [Candidatus Woesebacteria bacterium GW2011_GWB1_38_5b]|uniref:Acylneuraminate cytidylyltransferase n=1 Tax=Candidatus Woesebacteria bacterium GW2011_GWB1_38_5b TaxID=1618569 RepID=A0A0G0KJT2_9BACT|nr:MAG: Acylneuraminate cytidylyltransferase [Candidatus Woesebacteria bacterium GW2011_GWB1_38_5b]
MIVAIITARGGSKRIPRKNIKLFLGKPIIGYSISAALHSKIFDEVMVSTEDEEIAKVSKKLGAKIPFMRSLKTAGDHVGSAAVVEEVLQSYKKIGKKIDMFCLIYPTAPFLTPEKLRNTYREFKKSKSQALVPVVRFSYPIQRAVKIVSGKLLMIWPKNYHKHSQDLMPAYHDCGQFYWFRTKPFLKQKKLFLRDTIAWEIPESEVQDIDNFEDWKIAEIKYKILH